MPKSVQASGFTLIELLIVVSIITIMTGALIPSFSAYTKTQALRQAQEQVLNDLFTAQNNALTGQKSTFDSTSITHWGIRFTHLDPTYEFVTTSTTCAAAIPSREVTLGEELSIVIPGALAASDQDCILFSLANGSSANDSIRVKRDSGNSCYEVNVTEVGLITRNKTLITPCP